MSDITQFDYKKHWQQEEIILERSRSGDESWGFTIAGGIDLPFLHRHFTSIIVTNIRENGLAYRDKRLKLYDIILRVNNIDFTNITHKKALEILRQSRPKVQLLIRRLSPLIIEKIELEHNGQLGLFIVGGIGHEYFSDDHGIFITKIVEHQTNKQLHLGDRLLQISSLYNTYDLRFVTHEKAKQCIELACKESQKVKLYVGHTRSAIEIQNERTILHEDDHDRLVPKDADATQYQNIIYSVVSDKDYHRKLNYNNTIYETMEVSLNESDTENRNDHQLIVSFDFDDYQRYENRSINNSRTSHPKLLLTVNQQQPHIIKSTTATAPKDLQSDSETNTHVEQLNNLDKRINFRLYDSPQITFDDKKSAQQLKENEAVIRAAKEEKLRRQQSKISQNARLQRAGMATGINGTLRWQVG